MRKGAGIIYLNTNVMFTSQLTLESRLIECDDDTTFVIKANNTNCAASLEFYGTPEEFKEFADELVDFPKTIDQEVHYPPRSRYDSSVNYAYWLTIKVFCYDPSGHVALEISIGNKEVQPWNYQSRFCIQTDAATLNRFGQRLRGWDAKSCARISLYEERE